MPNDTNTASLADEMDLPAPPPLNAETAATSHEATSIDAEIPEDLASTIPDAPEAMPKGISEFRLASFEERTSKESAPGLNDGDPYFNLKWVCQSEPNTGRTIYDMIPWVTAQTVKDAGDPTSPNCQQARNDLKIRLWKYKQLTKAAGWSNTGGMKPKEFFATNPTVKIDHGQKERQQKGAIVAGKQTYVSFNPPQFDGKVNKYLPLM